MALTRTLLVAGLAFGASLFTGGCRDALEYSAPPGFAAADEDWRSAHFKASDNVGLKLLVFDNVDGGTLPYWGQDLVAKLRERGYTLLAHKRVQAANKVEGTQFDLEVQGHFLIVGLFVTDDYRYVVQLAGDSTLREQYGARMPEIVAELHPIGCTVRSRICRGQQPPQLAQTSKQ